MCFLSSRLVGLDLIKEEDGVKILWGQGLVQAVSTHAGEVASCFPDDSALS